MGERNGVPVVLASSSPRRRELLGLLGITPHVVAADIDGVEGDPSAVVTIDERLALARPASLTSTTLDGAVALSWGVSRFALDIPWRIYVGEHVIGVLATAALVAAIGVLSSLDVLRNKPLATLRAE